jgi:DNA-binding IclR family transcriptional regulator
MAAKVRCSAATQWLARWLRAGHRHILATETRHMVQMKNDNEDKLATNTYSAPALDKGLDILELLCRTGLRLTQKDIAQRLDRSVGEIYRMLDCLVKRDYVALADDAYQLSTKLFELAHLNPPMHRLLIEARPIMETLSSELEQSCHLTVWGMGRQTVIAKVDVPTGMGFSVRVGSELDVIVSVSGRVLLAFQTDEVRATRVSEALDRRPDHADPEIDRKLEKIRKRGFETKRSGQVRGLYAVSYPILDTQGHAVAALTVPYAERIDQEGRKSIPQVEEALGAASARLTSQLGGRKAGKGA